MANWEFVVPIGNTKFRRVGGNSLANKVSKALSKKEAGRVVVHNEVGQSEVRLSVSQDLDFWEVFGTILRQVSNVTPLI